MAAAVDKENAVLGRAVKGSRVPLSPTRKPCTPLSANSTPSREALGPARSIDEGPALAPQPRPDERLTAAKRGAHVVIPTGLSADATIAKLRNALINEQEDKKQYVLEFERIQEEGKALFTTYVAKCNRLKEISADCARLKQELTEKNGELTVLKQRLQEESHAANEARNKCRQQTEEFRANFAAFRALKEENEALKQELAKEKAGVQRIDSKEIDALKAALAAAEAQRKEAKDNADLAMVLARDRAARLEALENMQKASTAKSEASVKFLSEQLRDRDALHAAALAQAEAEKKQAQDRAAELEEKLRSAEAEFKLAEGLFTSTHEETQAALVAAQNAKLRADEDAMNAGKRLSDAERAATEEKTRREESVARLEAEREMRQKAELAAEERLAAARAQLESAEANLQRITAHAAANERVRSAAELLESEQAKARDREAEHTAIISTLRTDLEKERQSSGVRLTAAEEKFKQLQRHTRALLEVKDKATKELAEATAKLADVEANAKKSEDGLKGAKERMQSLEVEIAQLRQRLNVANTAATRAQEAASAALVDLENARLEAENCRNVLKTVERDANEASLSRDILLNERSQLVLQIEILILLSESSGDIPPPLLKLAAEHFALQREQAALQTKCDTAVREAERLRRELMRLARHARPAPAAEQSSAKV